MVSDHKTALDRENRIVALFDPDFARCPQPTYQDLHAHCPNLRASFTNSPVISRYDDVVQALRQPKIFSSAMEMQMALGTERPMIPQQVDPPDQTRYRKLLDPHFSRKKMEALALPIRQQANALIDEFIDDGGCEFDSRFAIPLPCIAFLSLVGLPVEELDFFLEVKDGIIRPNKNNPDLPLEDLPKVRVESGKKIYAYFDGVIDDRLAKPGDDLLTSLVHAEIEGEKLTREEILDICFLLILAGLDTVTATLGCNVAYLASNPEQRQRLVSDPALVPSAVEELLRWETPVTAVPRVAKRNVTIGDLEIAEGEVVTMLLGAANVDAEHFDRADVVDFQRERNIHTAFGVGPHRCLGSHLARMELRVALEEWHRRIPDYRIKAGETPTYSPGIREVLYLPLEW